MENSYNAITFNQGNKQIFPYSFNPLTYIKEFIWGSRRVELKSGSLSTSTNRWSEDSNNPLTILPFEIFLHILSFACTVPKETNSVRLVKKSWMVAVDDIQIWKQIARRYLDVNSSENLKSDVCALFIKERGLNYPPKLIALFGGFEKVIQIPRIKKLKKNEVKTLKPEDCAGHPVAKFVNAKGRDLIGIPYVMTLTDPISNFSSNTTLDKGRHKGVIVFMQINASVSQQKLTWTCRDTLKAIQHSTAYYGILDINYGIEIVEAMLKGPCRLDMTDMSIQPDDTSINNKLPLIEQWKPEKI